MTAPPCAAQPPEPGSPKDWLRAKFGAEEFERTTILIENTFMQTGADGGASKIAYIHEGLVRGLWHRDKTAPSSNATALVAGDGCWIGVDAFKYGENMFRYQALVRTTATVVPMSSFTHEAPRSVIGHAFSSVARDWCTAVSLLSLGNQTLTRRALLLLHHMRRIHPRPEIEVRQQDLADMLGVARQTLQPVLKRLAAAGLIDLGYGEIVVADSERLFAALKRGTRPATGPVRLPPGHAAAAPPGTAGGR